MSGIKLSKWGTIEVDEVTYETSRPGVFAAGDVHTGPWIAIEAVGGGIEAAESIDRYLPGHRYEGRPSGRQGGPQALAGPAQGRRGGSRVEMATLPPEVSCQCFDEIAKGYTQAQAEAEASRCLNCGICSECMQCVAACQAGAIDHSMKPAAKQLNVGALILSPGFKPFDPTKYSAYHYANYPNVVTGMEFERILSASGPFAGHLIRPSDHAEPKKIAWLQCVGSRDLHHCDNSYCSAVCCMYAIKQAVIAKEHSKEPLDAAIFFMDMRTHGKDFEKYYWRAEEEHGVRFLRSRVHTIDPVPGTGDLAIRYLSENGELKVEEFDMVVLSVGLEASPEALQLAKTLGVDIKPETRFATTSAFTPVNTNKPGVYVCGAFQAPKDIPQSVMEASAAAAAAGELLNAARGTAIKVPEVAAGDGRHRSGTPGGRLCLQLRHQYRRGHQRPGPYRIRGHPAGRGPGRPEPVYLLRRHPGQDPGGHQGKQTQPGGGGLVQSPHPCAPVHGNPAAGRAQSLSLRDGQHPGPGFLGAHARAGKGPGKGQGTGADGRGPGNPAGASRENDLPGNQGRPGDRRRGRRDGIGPVPRRHGL